MKLFKKEISKRKLLYGGLISTFVILYVATAFVSWYHAITFFNIANAAWLSVILSFVAEIGQASVLFSILLTELKKTSHIVLSWAVMILLTTLQVIGNVVSSYDWIISHNGAGVEAFQKSILFWVQTENRETFMIIIAWISGALLPIIALSMTSLVAQYMELRSEDTATKLDHEVKPEIKPEVKPEPIDAKDIISEVSKVRLSEDELIQIEEFLKSKKPIEKPPAEEIPIEEKASIDNSQFKSPPVYAVEKEIHEVLPHYSDEEVLEMFMDEYERKGKYFPDDLDEEVERLTAEAQTGDPVGLPGKPGWAGSDDPDDVPEYIKEQRLKEKAIEPEVVISHTNGLVEIPESGTPNPDIVTIPLPKTTPDDEEKKRIEEERLERLRAIARENLKKK